MSINETDETQPFPSDPVFLLSVQCSASSGTSITYSLLKEDGAALTIGPTTGDISATAGLDYETVSKLTFTSVCSATNNPDLNSTARVTVNLLPTNEHRPVVSNSVLELMNCSTPLGPLNFLLPGIAYSISDSDRPKGPIYYFFDGNTYDNTFSFNVTTGGFNLLKRISQRVMFIQFTFRITICDVSPPLHTCPNHVMLVTYTSLNSYTPVFSRAHYSTSVLESVPVNTTLLTLNCTDEDRCSGAYGGMEIIVNNMIPDGMFSLDQNGNIKNLQPLDFEDTQSYDLRVRCYDEPLPRDVQRYAVSTVSIMVLDANDNPPRCSSSNFIASLSVGTYQNSHKVLFVSCEDDDVGANSQLTYTVQGGLPKISTGQFNLDPTTGVLTFIGEAIPTGNSYYEIIVIVSDSGDTSLTARVKVTVNITEPGLKRVKFPKVAVIVMSMVGGLFLLCCAGIFLLICLHRMARHRHISSAKSLV